MFAAETKFHGKRSTQSKIQTKDGRHSQILCRSHGCAFVLLFKWRFAVIFLKTWQLFRSYQRTSAIVAATDWCAHCDLLRVWTLNINMSQQDQTHGRLQPAEICGWFVSDSARKLPSFKKILACCIRALIFGRFSQQQVCPARNPILKSKIITFAQAKICAGANLMKFLKEFHWNQTHVRVEFLIIRRP